MYTDLTTLCIGRASSLRAAIAQMDRSRFGIVLVTDDQRRLVGTITDGDIRRAILANVDLEQSVNVLLARKATTRFAKPITAAAGSDPNLYLALLKQHNILHLPLIDDEQHVVGMVTRDEFLPNEVLPLHAVVMAGGLGSRLHPLTEELPKPMLPIGNRPLLEIIIAQLREAGIRRVQVTTHHKPEKIEEHFGDGKDFGINLSYVAEDRPLGTAGALGLLGVPKETTLVMNGDILTQVDFRAMLVYHREYGADLTMAVRQYDLKVPYGVVECEDSVVRSLSEKPTVGFFVNAGIYLLEPPVYQFIPNGQPFDMTELIQCLLKAGRMVVSFPVREYWLDIGEHAGYERAEQDVRNEKVRV
ncbi:MAG: nucleotidyltransferase family protein [Candidatus Omnitrophica bacterium]|nr:nucleotidyltransferase family protein [Candidatus Omnitrophota bacterium]